MFASLKTLRAMTAREIIWRARSMAFAKYEEALYRLAGQGVPSSAAFRPSAATKIRFPLSPGAEEREDVVDWLRRRSQAYVGQIEREAATVRDRRFTLLGLPVRYGREVPWCTDPVSGRPWPMLFHSKVKIFGGDSGFGDFKYVWELNRHQFLVVLGKAYYLTANEEYAAECADLWNSWIEANPYEAGINWTSALEVAVRSLSWIWTYALLGNSTRIDERTRERVLGSLEQHGRYIETHLSHYFSPYNHLVGETAALYVLGATLPFMKRAKTWEEKGWRLLDALLPTQFHEDGGCVEQATSYHHFTLGFYLQAVLLRRACGGYVSDASWRRLERAFEFAMHLTRPDGMIPMIGDADEAMAIELGQPSLWDYRPYLAVGATLFGRGDMKRIAGAFPEEAVWLLGLKGADAYDRLGAIDPEGASRIFVDSGYATMRTGWNRDAHQLIFDCGEIAAGVVPNDVPSSAHGHADVLSVEVSAYGRAVIVDPGFFTYNGDLAWHRYFRETTAHNTVVVDGHSQAEFRGRLRWSRGPRAEFDRWTTSADFDYVEGTHDGYARLPRPVLHRRSVLFAKPDYWLVRDEFLGHGEHKLDVYFHFAPVRLRPDEATTAVHTCAPDGRNLTVFSIEKEGVTLDLIQNGEGPSGGWVATGYGKRVRAPIACFRSTGALPTARHTLLVPFRAEPAKISAEAIPVSCGTGAALPQAFLVTIGERRDVVIFSSDGRPVQFHGDWLTDARAAWIRLDGTGRAEACVLINGSTLIVDGEPILRTSRAVGCAAARCRPREAVIELSEPTDLSTSLPNARVVVAANSQGGRGWWREFTSKS